MLPRRFGNRESGLGFNLSRLIVAVEEFWLMGLRPEELEKQAVEAEDRSSGKSSN
jgi:hypothetical protein